MIYYETHVIVKKCLQVVKTGVWYNWIETIHPEGKYSNSPVKKKFQADILLGHEKSHPY